MPACCGAASDVVDTRPVGQPVPPETEPEMPEASPEAAEAPVDEEADPADSKLVTKRWHVYPTHVEDAAKAAKAAELLEAMREAPTFETWRWYVEDGGVLRRFLTARDDDVAKAKALLLNALEWRARRRPHVVDYAEIEAESRTGKLRVAPSLDRWGRPVVVFDNSVQNTKESGGQLRCLAFVLEHALRRVDGRRASKYVIFMHLSDFSLFNNPPWSVTRETMLMLMSCFAECCGHIVVHGAPRVFRGVFAAVKPLIDPKTATKIVFVSPGAEEEPTMRELLGDDWRALTGAGLPRETPRSSPGYRHATSWRATLEADARWRARTGNRGPLRHEAVNWPEADVAAADDAPSELEVSLVEPPAPAPPPAAVARPPPPPPKRHQSLEEGATRLLGLHPFLERLVVLAVAFAAARVVALAHALV